ncbi:MAG: homocysteine S-methyltransferase family protein [Ruminiclostridium sp.]|nr:homocysteine S-methyltransferase family protein [Ruminiclostridium sp.]
MKPILEAIKEKRHYLDGGLGSMLQAAGLPDGLLPDLWSIQNPEAVQNVHRQYLEAGCRLIATNTFGTNAQKLAPYGVTPREVMTAAVANVRAAMDQAGVTDGYVLADIGPTGKLLKPYGDLDFEDAVALFADTIAAAQEAGADAILIETMSDLYEMKAALVAAKENCSLPIFASCIFDTTGKLLTGGSPRAMVALMEGMGVDLFGLNCGLGPKEMAGVFEQMWADASTPLLLQPNAGLPRAEGGKTVYDVSPADYAQQMLPLAPMATVMGGCCGTTPAHLKALIEATKEIPLPVVTQKDACIISSYCQAVVMDGKDPVIIGERINPTGKKKLQAALREGDTDYVLNEAFRQEDAGAHILDVNVGLPGIDEPAVLTRTMEAIQEVTGLPLQLDTANPEAMERALRRYNGKALINSVNGKEESLNAILPLVKKYGGGLVCLCLDDNGIPETAEGRLAIAQKILDRAQALGIPRRDLLVDGLTMPVSAGKDNAKVTLETIRRAKEELGLKTALGVSNVSFGLPRRELLNESFFTQALQNGLDGSIINPLSEPMMGAFKAYRALNGLDDQCQDYMETFQNTTAPVAASPAPSASPKAAADTGDMTLCQMVCKGLKEKSAAQAKTLADSGKAILDIINGELVPALDEVGKGFEKGTLFLPQLLMSAEAAKEAFAVLKDYLPAAETGGEPQILLATVKGDIHDIGKNIVKVLLESYRFRVLDLGKDVAPETIVATARERKIPVVGLSALMTTTAPAMVETIRQVKEAGLDCKVVVGGAVITQDYADSIGADHYAPDAMDTVHYAQTIFGD